MAGAKPGEAASLAGLLLLGRPGTSCKQGISEGVSWNPYKQGVSGQAPGISLSTRVSGEAPGNALFTRGSGVPVDNPF